MSSCSSVWSAKRILLALPAPSWPASCSHGGAASVTALVALRPRPSAPLQASTLGLIDSLVLGKHLPLESLACHGCSPASMRLKADVPAGVGGPQYFVNLLALLDVHPPHLEQKDIGRSPSVRSIL